MRTFVKGDATTRTGVPARAVDLLARGWVEITDETPPGHEDFDVHSWTPPTTSTVTVARGETVVTPETARSYRDQAPPRSPADDRDDTPD